MTAKQVWKYELPFVRNEIYAPDGAIPLFIGMQNLKVHLWMMVSPDMELKAQTYRVYGTGHELPDDMKYVGSTTDREFVWHVFKVIEEGE